jgi:hypothetical protein
MRTASNDLQEFLLASNVAWRCDLWTITTKTGTIYRWTTADIPVTYGSNTFLPGGGESATAPIVRRAMAKQTAVLTVDTLDLTLVGPFRISGKTLPQLATSGFFDEAVIRLDHMVGAYPGDTSIGAVQSWFEGTAADVEPDGPNVNIRIKSALETLNTLLPRYSLQPQCGYCAFDSGCGISKAANTFAGTIATSTTEQVTTTTAAIIAKPDGWFDFGAVTFGDGSQRTIKRHSLSGGVATLTLQIPLTSAPSGGISLFANCNRNPLKCGIVYGTDNTANYRGFPLAPAAEAAAEFADKEHAQRTRRDYLGEKIGLGSLGWYPPVVVAKTVVSTMLGSDSPLPIAYGTVKLSPRMIERALPSGPYSYSAWASSTHYDIGQRIAKGFVWEVTTGGTSGTDPDVFMARSVVSAIARGESATVTDGVVEWKSVGPAATNIYVQSFLAALCEGEVHAAKKIYWDKSSAAAINGTTFQHNLTLHKGTSSQTTPTCGTHPYRNTAMIGPRGTSGVLACDTGTQTEIPTIAAEIEAVMVGEGTYADPPPCDILNDLLTHGRRGCAWSSSRIDSSVTGLGESGWRRYCDAAGLRFSLVIDDRRQALDVIRAIIAATNSSAIFSGGKLKVVPHADATITTPVYGSQSFAPNNQAAYNLGPDDFLEPVKISRTSYQDTFNTFPVTYIDRSADYSPTTIEEQDVNDAIHRGVKRADDEMFPVIFPDREAASVLSRVRCQRSLYSRNIYSFVVGWRYLLLEPTDIVTLTDPLMGLDLTPVRILTMDESEDGLRFTAEDWPSGIASTKHSSPPGFDGYVPSETRTISHLHAVVDGNGLSMGLPYVVLSRGTDFSREYPGYVNDIGDIYPTIESDMWAMLGDDGEITIPVDGLYSVRIGTLCSVDLDAERIPGWVEWTVRLTRGSATTVIHTESREGMASSAPVLKADLSLPLQHDDKLALFCSWGGTEESPYSGLTARMPAAGSVFAVVRLA